MEGRTDRRQAFLNRSLDKILNPPLASLVLITVLLIILILGFGGESHAWEGLAFLHIAKNARLLNFLSDQGCHLFIIFFYFHGNYCKVKKKVGCTALWGQTKVFKKADLRNLERKLFYFILLYTFISPQTNSEFLKTKKIFCNLPFFKVTLP